MFLDELPDGPRIGKPATVRAGVKPGARVSDDVLVSAVEDGAELHDSLRDLAARGWTEPQLADLMNRSAAKEGDPVRWQKRFNEIPRLVSSAAKKQAKRAEQAFGGATAQFCAVAPIPDGPQLPALPMFKPADMAARPIKPRKWIIQDLIPEGEPCLIYGKGAAGKSLVLFQLCIAVAAGQQWIGLDVPSGRAIMFTCEDSVDELGRRAASILKMMDVEWSDCADRLLIVPMRGADADAVLATPTANGVLQATPTYHALKAIVADFKPDIVVVDTLADTFAGNENVRAEAKMFINMIARLRIDATHLVTAHLSVSAEEDGRGFSGSTGWPAACRASLTFGRPKSGPFKDDTDVRLLESKKGNYAKEGAGAILMRWKEGAFVPETGAAAMPEYDVDELFMRLLARYAKAGRNVGDKPGSIFAPKLFSEEREAKAAGADKQMLRDAMARLFEAGRITLAKQQKQANGRVPVYLAIVEGVPAPLPWEAAG